MATYKGTVGAQGGAIFTITLLQGSLWEESGDMC